MTIDDINKLIEGDEHRKLELKKSTGELKDGMQSACAFLNTEGGWLIFGITPNSLKVVGQLVTDNTQREISQALAGLEPQADVRAEYIDVPNGNGKKLIALHFDACKDGQVPYTYLGRPYYRVESTTKQMPRDMYDERLRNSNPRKYAWEVQIADGLSITDLDEQRIRNAVRGGVAGGRINASAENDSIESLLEKFKLMHDGKITNAAVVLFGKNLYNYPQLMLRMAYFRGTDKLVFKDNKQAEGNFFDLLDAGVAFCFRHLSLSGEVKGLLREEHLEIPIEALREALTNALCHRRFDDPRTSVTLAIFDDRIEITNPGRFPAPLTPENIKEPHGSFPYNLRIAQVLYLSTYLEGWGTGVHRMIDICRMQGVPEPVFEADGYSVKITFMRPSQKTSQKASQKDDEHLIKMTQKEDVSSLKIEDVASQKNLGESQKMILKMVSANPKITTSEMASHLGIDRRNVQDHIKKLQNLELLRREGGRKNGSWVLLIGNPDTTC